MGRQKQTVVSFRVDAHLAEILNNLPDKSSFIRDAILRRVHTVCPCCRGRGVLPGLIADWLATRLPKFKSIECTCCHYEYPVALVRQALRHSRPGPFVCPHCAAPDHQH